MYMYVHVFKYGRKKAVLKYLFYVSRPSDDGKFFKKKSDGCMAKVLRFTHWPDEEHITTNVAKEHLWKCIGCIGLLKFPGYSVAMRIRGLMNGLGAYDFPAMLQKLHDEVDKVADLACLFHVRNCIWTRCDMIQLVVLKRSGGWLSLNRIRAD